MLTETIKLILIEIIIETIKLILIEIIIETTTSTLIELIQDHRNQIGRLTIEAEENNTIKYV